MVDSGALFTQGLFRKHLVPDKTDRYYLWVGRISGFAVTMLGVLYAMYLIERVLYSFLLTETLATFMGISILGGIVWSRANRWGAIASLIAALSTNFSMYYLRNQRLDHWDADVFFTALLAGAAALVVVSLLTSPEPKEETESFFGRLQTPATSPEEGDSVDFGVGEFRQPSLEQFERYAKDGEQSMLINLLQLRKGTAGVGFWRAYRGDLKGFVIGCILSVGLVLCTWLFLKL